MENGRLRAVPAGFLSLACSLALLVTLVAACGPSAAETKEAAKATPVAEKAAPTPVPVRSEPSPTPKQVAAATPAPAKQEAVTTPAAKPLSKSPDTTAAAVMAYLKDQDYAKTWQLWPDKGQNYRGAPPHGPLMTTYLNPVALDALQKKAGALPDGSIIVKESRSPEGNLVNIAIMYKVKGYDAANRDWYWLEYDAQGKVLFEGKAQICFACHSVQEENDYVYTGPLK